MNMSVELAGLILSNPVIAASGTFGFGREYSHFYDLNKLGGISIKGLTLEPRQGNPPPRIAETPGGILNSVGLQNPGVHYFIENELAYLKQYNTGIIANIAGNTVDDYIKMVEILDNTDIDAFEVNVSCPNVKEGGAAFGISCAGIEEITRSIRPLTKKPVIIKLTPNVTSISDAAKSAEYQGADAVSLINTLLGMKIDIHTRRPVLANNYGGLSGPAVMPIAVRMVNEVYNSVKIPIIGMGGIFTGEDALEFLLAGATAVMVGTANFVNPTACIDVVNGIESYCNSHGIKNVSELTGAIELY